MKDKIKSGAKTIGYLSAIGGLLYLTYGGESKQPQSSTISNINSYESINRDYDCSDFSSHSEAQSFFEDQGGPDLDPHKLDRDGDGLACELN